jgi:hypothetical protein
MVLFAYFTTGDSASGGSSATSPGPHPLYARPMNVGDMNVQFPYIWNMVTIIKKGASIQSIKKKLSAVKVRKKGLDARKYLGALKISLDPLQYQSDMRNEWR